MKRILWSLILCLTSTLVSAQTAEDVGNFIQTRLDGFSIDRVEPIDNDCFIASFIGGENITSNQAKQVINNRIINAYDDVNVIEPWEENNNYEHPTETIMLYVDNNNDDAVFSIGMAVVNVDKYHTAITMCITRGSRAKLGLNNKR